MIFIDLSMDEFVREFSDYGREDNFSYYGLKALYEYLSDISEVVPLELDVIAICCEWSEYSLEDAVSAYSYLIEEKDIDTMDEMVDILNEHTTVLRTDCQDTIVVAEF